MPSNLLRGKGCARCKQSLMEEEIDNFLSANDIKFIRQYPINRLRIDFFLPDYNIAIECQGIQHFKPVDIFGGEEAFTIQKIRDESKKKLCDKNNIRLIYYADYKYKFPYSVIKNKEELLETILNYKQND